MATESPTLADDEASLAAYAAALGDAFEQISGSWFIRLIEERLPGVTMPDDVAKQLHIAAKETTADLRKLLAVDIAAQHVGPLEILRRSIAGVPTEVLRSANVPVAVRDEFSRSNFPNDIYGLTPASFRDVDPALHEPGLVWGAAKAHVHLRRRRDAASE